MLELPIALFLFFFFIWLSFYSRIKLAKIERDKQRVLAEQYEAEMKEKEESAKALAGYKYSREYYNRKNYPLLYGPLSELKMPDGSTPSFLLDSDNVVSLNKRRKPT